jgi:phosphopantothenoylcysteine decarboxylase / phosphopantothenate---cysteine ligase
MRSPLAGLRVLVTAGPTREPIDPVRFLSNASTGRMGWELAREARRRGARVALVLGPCELPDPEGVDVVRVETARQMLAAARRAARGTSLAVFAAAPADWRPARAARGKRPKASFGGRPRLALVENPDVAATLGRRKGARVHVGFALETGDAIARARRKMAAKRFDAVVVNGPRNVGRGGGAAWFVGGGAPVRLPTGDKAATARAILDLAEALLPPHRQRSSIASP